MWSRSLDFSASYFLLRTHGVAINHIGIHIYYFIYAKTISEASARISPVRTAVPDVGRCEARKGQPHHAQAERLSQQLLAAAAVEKLHHLQYAAEEGHTQLLMFASPHLKGKLRKLFSTVGTGTES